MKWRWAFGMFAEGQFEVLGAWMERTVTAHIFDELKARGVERIRLASTDDAIEGAGLIAEPAGADNALTSQPLTADRFGPRALVADEFTGRKRKALLLAISTAERLRTGLVRALRHREPFASDEAAMAFIAQWLERADCSLFGALPSSRASAARPNVVPSCGADSRRIATH